MYVKDATNEPDTLLLCMKNLSIHQEIKILLVCDISYTCT